MDASGAMKALIGEAGCGADGVASASNPFASIIRSVADRVPVPGGHHPASRDAPQPGFTMLRDPRQPQGGPPSFARQRSAIDVGRSVAAPDTGRSAMESAWGSARAGRPPQAARMMPGMMMPRGPPMSPHMFGPQLGASPILYGGAPQTSYGMPPPAAVHPASWSGGRVEAPVTSTPAPARTMAASAPTAEAAAAPAREAEDESRIQAERLAEVLASNPDPKVRQSELRNFLSAVARGDLSIEKDKVVDTAPVVSEAAEAEARAHVHDTPIDPFWKAKQSELIREKTHPVPKEKRGFDSFWAEAQREQAERLERAWAEAMAADAAEDEAEAGEGEAKSASDMPPVYEFKNAEENPYLDKPDAFELGKQFFDKGELDNAILAFESVIKKDAEHSDAWRMLGLCHAENDEDRKAIDCQQRAVDVDPYNLEALSALGVSFVNELKYDKALVCLRAWIQHNPKFQGLKVEEDPYSDGSLMDSVVQLMTKAAEWDPTDDKVQVVLGILFNVSKDWDAAVKAFRQAIEHHPDDHSLWNKLGATLANSGRNREALPIYQKALSMKPNYARGWLNLAIALASQSDYEDAIRAYIRALQLNPKALHIWSYIRIALTCISRYDLVHKSEGTDVKTFSEVFEAAMKLRKAAQSGSVSGLPFGGGGGGGGGSA